MSSSANANGERVSLRGWLAFLIIATTCVMSAFRIEIGEPLKTIAAITVGFYFASHAATQNGNGQTPTK